MQKPILVATIVVAVVLFFFSSFSFRAPSSQPHQQQQQAKPLPPRHRHDHHRRRSSADVVNAAGGTKRRTANTNLSAFALAAQRLYGVPQMLACAAKLTQAVYWDYLTSSCQPIEGTTLASASERRQFKKRSSRLSRLAETSPTEMVCRQEQNSWVVDAFSKDPNFAIVKSPTSTLADVNVSLPPLPPLIKNKYSAFQFFTSFLFRQYLPWTPYPVATTTFQEDYKKKQQQQQQQPQSLRYRSWHDPSIENLMRVENFCISPFSGLSGYKIERADEYVGRSDTRDFANHQEFALSKHLFKKSNIRNLLRPPQFFDKRRVVFFPIQPRSRFNVAHQVFRVLSLLGVLRLLLPSSASALGQREPPPLIVIVSPCHSRGKKKEEWLEETSKVSMLGFFFRAIQQQQHSLPIAAITPEKYPDGYYERMFALTDHSLPVKPSSIPDLDSSEPEFGKPSAATVNNGASSSSSSFGDSRVCFSSGVVWQNCHSCSTTELEVHNPIETESYSFGNFVRVTPERKSLVQQLRRAVLESCLGFERVAPARRRFWFPRIFFDVRSSSCPIRNFGLMMDQLQQRFVVPTTTDDSSSFDVFSPHQEALASSMTFAELWKTPRAFYLDRLINADIFICIHGGSCAQTIMAGGGGRSSSSSSTSPAVLVELQPDGFHCSKERPDCWWGVFTESLGQSLIVVSLPKVPTSTNDIVVSQQFLERIIETAICEFWRRQQQQEDPTASPKTTLPAVCKSNSMPEVSNSKNTNTNNNVILLEPNEEAHDLEQPSPAKTLLRDIVAQSLSSVTSASSSSPKTVLSIEYLKSRVQAVLREHGGGFFKLVAHGETQTKFWHGALSSLLVVSPPGDEDDVGSARRLYRVHDANDGAIDKRDWVKPVQYYSRFDPEVAADAGGAATAKFFEIHWPMPKVICVFENDEPAAGEICLFVAVARQDAVNEELGRDVAAEHAGNNDLPH